METKKLRLVEAKREDINTVIEIESNPANSDFIWQGTYEEHLQEINDPNHRLLLVVEKSTDLIVGYVLIRLDFYSDILELRRLAIDKKGRGYGRETITCLMDYAFESMGINRFWLDVYPHNTVGIKLYESLGMTREGVLRQNYKDKDGYRDQIIYSILKGEYEGERGKHE